VDLELKNRSYVYFYNLTKLISLSLGSPEKYWLTRNNESLSANGNVSLLYNNKIFSVYKLN
jgi:hypothetical protein